MRNFREDKNEGAKSIECFSHGMQRKEGKKTRKEERMNRGKKKERTKRKR